MTVKQHIKQYGWQMDADNESILSRSMDVSINFKNDGVIDETQFQIPSFDENELSQLFNIFCKENDLVNNTVTNIIIVHLYEEKV